MLHSSRQVPRHEPIDVNVPADIRRRQIPASPDAVFRTLYPLEQEPLRIPAAMGHIGSKNTLLIQHDKAKCRLFAIRCSGSSVKTYNAPHTTGATTVLPRSPH